MNNQVFCAPGHHHLFCSAGCVEFGPDVTSSDKSMKVMLNSQDKVGLILETLNQLLQIFYHHDAKLNVPLYSRLIGLQ